VTNFIKVDPNLFVVTREPPLQVPSLTTFFLQNSLFPKLSDLFLGVVEIDMAEEKGMS